MCTTGAKILAPGHEFVLFKNRDFTRAHFDDRVRWTGQALGVLGLETWDGDDPALDRFSGYSIGANAQLACCDSNVRMVPGGENYDLLVQEVIDHCATVDEAIDRVRRVVGERLFGWANLLVASPQEVAALEVRDHTVTVERHSTTLARANHHVVLGATPADDDTTTTQQRTDTAQDGLAAATTLDEVFALLRSHTPDAQHSLCNHGLYTTVYSYVVHWQDGEVTLYVHQGHPCDGVDHTRLPIRFGDALDLARYPSRAAG